MRKIVRMMREMIRERERVGKGAERVRGEGR